MVRLPPRSPLFPYTTLFRSAYERVAVRAAAYEILRSHAARGRLRRGSRPGPGHWPLRRLRLRITPPGLRIGRRRSEEHTSELQSRFDLVCRLLLEKKKKTMNKRSDTDYNETDRQTLPTHLHARPSAASAHCSYCTHCSSHCERQTYYRLCLVRRVS